MVKNNKILEAINRGIQLALDDFEDIENNNSVSQSSDVIDSDDVIKNKIEFNKFFVDLEVKLVLSILGIFSVFYFFMRNGEYMDNSRIGKVLQFIGRRTNASLSISITGNISSLQ